NPTLAQQAVNELDVLLFFGQAFARRHVDALLAQQLAQATGLLTHDDRRGRTRGDVTQERVETPAVLRRVRERQTRSVWVEAHLDAIHRQGARCLTPGSIWSCEPGRHLAALQQVGVQLLDLLLELFSKPAQRLRLFHHEQPVSWQVVQQRRRAE